MRKFLLVLMVGFIIAFSIAGCKKPDEFADDSRNVGNIKRVNAIDYGNGVYYFPYIKAEFANSLSLFIKEHQNLKLTSFAGDGNGGYGSDRGYFVVFTDK